MTNFSFFRSARYGSKPWISRSGYRRKRNSWRFRDGRSSGRYSGRRSTCNNYSSTFADRGTTYCRLTGNLWTCCRRSSGCRFRRSGTGTLRGLRYCTRGRYGTITLTGYSWPIPAYPSLICISMIN